MAPRNLQTTLCTTGCIQLARPNHWFDQNKFFIGKNSFSSLICEPKPNQHRTRQPHKFCQLSNLKVSPRIRTPSLVLSLVTEVWLGRVGQYRHQPTTKKALRRRIGENPADLCNRRLLIHKVKNKSTRCKIHLFSGDSGF